jgi:dTDP-4-dehydrorhamnose 3,5-epimerase
MEVVRTEIPDVLLIQPKLFGDSRGCFMETFTTQRYAEHGVIGPFVQDNYSRSRRGTLRGLHYQIQQTQGKLVQVLRGEIYDVAVDLRRSSPTFGRWVGVTLSEENHRQLYIPPGFAHGFYVVSEDVDFIYKCTDYYAPQHDRTLLWSDPTIGIPWPLVGEPLLSDKDKQGRAFADADCFT